MKTISPASAAQTLAGRTRPAPMLAGMLMAIVTLLPALSSAGPVLPAFSEPGASRLIAERWAAGGCGYDPRGAEQGWHNSRMNALNASGGADYRLGISARVEDKDDIAVIEDDGSIVAQPSKFDLKNRSLLLTPDGSGYRITRTKTQFNTKSELKLNYFFGPGHIPGNSNNGYRDLELRGARFPFFGASYDTIFVGTNGYITFGEGDTSARPSVAALAYELPRIAPLWADLDLTRGGTLSYARDDASHVITWQAAPQAQYSGTSTFQAILYDDGRIAFVYKKVKARSAVIGISPGRSERDALAIDFSAPPDEIIEGPLFESFSQEKRLDLPALTRAFYSAHDDEFDMLYVWTDFPFDNGLGVAHAFNVRNDITGIGLNLFDRGSIYGSGAKLSSIFTMGDIDHDWPSDPQEHVVGLNSAVSIVCHELGHRWLAYVRFDAEHDIKDDLLGREGAHWSFFADTRTTEEGNFSSLMEGNSWRDHGNGNFTTAETAVNYFSKLDQYLMGLRAPEEVGQISFLVVDDVLKDLLRTKSPVSGFSLAATRKTTSVAQIVEREGVRIPSASDAQKEFRVAFVLLTEGGASPAGATLAKLARYRDSLVRYFSVATDRRGSLDASLN